MSWMWSGTEFSQSLKIFPTYSDIQEEYKPAFKLLYDLYTIISQTEDNMLLKIDYPSQGIRLISVLFNPYTKEPFLFPPDIMEPFHQKSKKEKS